MKKSLLALVALTAFAGAASAQSSVKIFGKIDAAVGKTIGSANKEVMDTAGSRIAFSGYEDLGAGMGALFALEHRFAVDTGNYGGGAGPVATTSSRMWEGFSYVGLRHKDIGTLTIGRQYTSSFLVVQSNIDPFAGETVAKLRDIGTALAASYPAFKLEKAMTDLGVPAATAKALAAARENPGKVRVENSLKYANTFGPVSVSADVAESSGTTTAKKPYSLAVAGNFGPAWVGVSYENPEGVNDELVNLGAAVKFGTARLSAGYADGKRDDNKKVKGMLLGVNVTVGSGDIKAGYATLKSDTTDVNKRFGIGYHHNLSKRTKVFVDYARDSKSTTEKAGYDLGIQHNF